MKKILVLCGLVVGTANAQVFNVPVQPPEMSPGYGLRGQGLHMAVPYGRPGLDCAINPVSMSFSLQEVEVTDVVEREVFSVPANVLFDFDRDVVRPEGVEALREVYNALVEGHAERIRIVGHTDSMGTDEYNMDLGWRRARAVAAVLISFGFVNLETDSAGESQPKVPNTNPDGSDNPANRQINRRVDIEVVDVANEIVVRTEVQRVAKNPQIFHRLASNYSVPCGDLGVPPGVSIAVGGSVGLAPHGGVVITAR